MTLRTRPLPNNVTTFIYAAFFTKVIAENEIIGTALWSRGVGIIMLVVALLSPPLGALSDHGGYRKRFLIYSTLLCVVFTALLYLPQQGQATYAMTLYIIACICFEMGSVFYNAFLPDIAPSERIGRISGQAMERGLFGWPALNGRPHGRFCIRRNPVVWPVQRNP